MGRIIMKLQAFLIVVSGTLLACEEVRPSYKDGPTAAAGSSTRKLSDGKETGKTNTGDVILQPGGGGTGNTGVVITPIGGTGSIATVVPTIVPTAVVSVTPVPAATPIPTVAVGMGRCAIGFYSSYDANKPVYSCPNNAGLHEVVKSATSDFLDSSVGAPTTSSICLSRASHWARACFVKGMRVKIKADFQVTTQPVPAAGQADTRAFSSHSALVYSAEDFK